MSLASSYQIVMSQRSAQADREVRIRTRETLEYVLNTLPAEQLLNLVRNAPSSSINVELYAAYLNARDLELGAKREFSESTNASIK